MSHNNYIHTSEGAWFGEWARNTYGEIAFIGSRNARWAGLALNGIDPPNGLMTGWTCKEKVTSGAATTLTSWEHDTNLLGKPKKVNVQVGWTYPERGRWKFWKVDPVSGNDLYAFMPVSMSEPDILSDPELAFTKQTLEGVASNEKHFTLVKTGCLLKFEGGTGNNGKPQSGLYDFWTRGPYNPESPTRGCTMQTWKALSNGTGGVTWSQVS